MELVIIGFLLCLVGALSVFLLRITIRSEGQIKNLEKHIKKMQLEQKNIRQELDDKKVLENIADDIIKTVKDRL